MSLILSVNLLVIRSDFLQEIDEVTEEDIAAVADRTSEKVYNTVLVSELLVNVTWSML